MLRGRDVVAELAAATTRNIHVASRVKSTDDREVKSTSELADGEETERGAVSALGVATHELESLKPPAVVQEVPHDAAHLADDKEEVVPRVELAPRAFVGHPYHKRHREEPAERRSGLGHL